MTFTPVYGDACSVRRIAVALARNTITRLTVGDTALHALDLHSAQQLQPRFRDCHSLLRLTLHLRHLSLNALRVLLAAAATCHSLTHLHVVGGTLSITESKVLASGIAALALQTQPAVSPHTPQPSRSDARARQRAWSAKARAGPTCVSPPPGRPPAGVWLTLSLHTLTSATAAMLLDGLRRSERVVRCELRVQFCADDEARALLRQCTGRLRALTQRNRERVICAGLPCRAVANGEHDITPRQRNVAAAAQQGRPACPHTPIVSVRHNTAEARASYAARLLQAHAVAPPPLGSPQPRQHRPTSRRAALAQALDAVPCERLAPHTPPAREDDGGEQRSATDHFRYYPRQPSPTSSPSAARVSPRCDVQRCHNVSPLWARRVFTPYSPAKFASPQRPRQRCRSTASSVSARAMRTSATYPERQSHARRGECDAAPHVLSPACREQARQRRGRARSGASSSASRSPSPRPPLTRWHGAMAPPTRLRGLVTPPERARTQAEVRAMRPVTPVPHRAHTPTRPPCAPPRPAVVVTEEEARHDREGQVAALPSPTREEEQYSTDDTETQDGGAAKAQQAKCAATASSAPSASVSAMHEELTPDRVSGLTQGPSHQPSRRWHSSPRVHIAMDETKAPSPHPATPRVVRDSASDSPSSSDGEGGEGDEDGMELQAVAYIRRCVRDINTALVRHQVKTSNVTQRLVREVEAWNADLSYRVTVQLSDIVMVLTDIERATTS